MVAVATADSGFTDPSHSSHDRTKPTNRLSGMIAEVRLVMATDLRTPPFQDASTGAALWRRRVEATPDDPFLVETTGAVASFQETDDRMRRVATGLAELGVGRGNPRRRRYAKRRRRRLGSPPYVNCGR